MDTNNSAAQGENTVMQGGGGGAQSAQAGDLGGEAGGGGTTGHEISTESVGTRDIQGELRTAKAKLATLTPNTPEYARFEGAVAALEWFNGSDQGISLTAALLSYQGAGQPIPA